MTCEGHPNHIPYLFVNNRGDTYCVRCGIEIAKHNHEFDPCEKCPHRCLVCGVER